MNRSTSDVEASLHALWVEALDGNQSSYRQVLDQLSHLLRGFLRRRMQHCPQDIEDIIQEVILAIHLKRHTYQAHQPLTAWVHAIAKYKYIDYLRAHRHLRLHDDIDDWADLLYNTPDSFEGESKRQVEAALALLPLKQRLAIEFTRLEGLSIEETSKKTGQTVAAVKVNIHRGLKLLASKFAAH